MKKYTIKDVAERVGVSVGTVSRVLNKASNVDEEICERTLRVVHDLNYKPSGRGRKRKIISNTDNALGNNGRSNTLAVCFPEISERWRNNDIFLGYMSGIESVCRERNFHLVLYMGDKVPSGDAARDMKERFSGLLVKGLNADIEWISELRKYFPVVGLGMNIPSCPIPQVVFDDIGSGIIAVEELYKKGHRKIAFINVHPWHKMFISRSLGYMQACKQLGIYKPDYLIEFPEQPTYKEPDKVPPNCEASLDLLLSMRERPTAVVCANDWAAAGFYQACNKKGMDIPNDFSVLGFDDIGDLCHVLTPPLSSIAMPFTDCGKVATSLLIDLVESQKSFILNTASIQCLAGKVKIRDSVVSI